ncbi:MAG: SRPBCC domain-containing protein [Chloroflexi bacterium]|nr:SRPBCC domain-containing protein [Chloroflexota bacterium]
MKATREEVWRRLVDPTEIEGWSGASAVMEAWPGGRFELWGGDMFGVNLEVAPPRKLVQQWQVRGWEEPSTVTFTLRSNRAEGQTIVELVHAGVPAEEAEEYAQGWDEHYLGAIKRGLG